MRRNVNYRVKYWRWINEQAGEWYRTGLMTQESAALGDNHGLLEWFIYYNEWGSRKLSVQIDDGPERVITNYDDILNVIEDLQE